MITVYVISDYLAVRAGIRSLLHGAEDIEVIGEASGFDAAVDGCRELSPHLVIADVCLSRDRDSLRFIRDVAPDLPGTKVVMIMSSTTRSHIDQALGYGAMGYLAHASLSQERLIDAVRQVAGGTRVIDDRVLDLIGEAKEEPGRDEALTKRESQVLMHVADGLSNKQIAEKLQIDHKTVRNHLNSIYCKLGLNSRLKAAMYVRDKAGEPGGASWLLGPMHTWVSVVFLFCMCR